MSVSVTVVGTPTKVRFVDYQQQKLICLDFEETANTAPFDLPAPSNYSLTALLTQEQWHEIQRQLHQLGGTINQLGKLRIQGKITLDMPMDVVEGEIGILCYNVVCLTNAPSDLVAELHAKYDGVCQECGQRCDKSVVFMREIENPKIIVCTDCYNGRKPLSFSVDEKLLNRFLEVSVDMDRESALSYLLTFPQKYALIKVSKHSRLYWTWDKSQPIKLLYSDENGHINHLVYRTSSHNEKRNPSKYIVKGTAYSLLQNNVARIGQLVIPDSGNQHGWINMGKIQFHLDYYQAHNCFIKRVTVARHGKKKLKILKGRHIYLAAKMLGLKQLPVRIMQPVSDEKVFEYIG